MRFICCVAVVLYLPGCVPVAVDHYQSEARIEEGLNRKMAAEKSAIEFAGAARPENVGQPLAQIDLASLNSARLALARDAQQDYALASGRWINALPQDRVSALLRAGRKSWYAGIAADPDLVKKIVNAGKKHCDKLGTAAPVRDCQLLGLMDELSGLQSARDQIFDTNTAMISRSQAADAFPQVSDGEVPQLLGAMYRMERHSADMGATKELRADIVVFVQRQQIDYWCWAVDAMTMLRKGPPTSVDSLAMQARALMMGNANGAISDELAGAIAKAGRTRGQLDGIYPSYSTRVLAGFSGNAGVAPGNLARHKRVCKAAIPGR